MSLNIKNPETKALATELAAISGKTITDAVTDALRAELQRRKTENHREELVADIIRIGNRFSAQMDSKAHSSDHGEILYDEMGLPK